MSILERGMEQVQRHTQTPGGLFLFQARVPYLAVGDVPIWKADSPFPDYPPSNGDHLAALFKSEWHSDIKGVDPGAVKQ